MVVGIADVEFKQAVVRDELWGEIQEMLHPEGAVLDDSISRGVVDNEASLRALYHKKRDRCPYFVGELPRYLL